MDQSAYRTYEAFMLTHMQDSAHDPQHIYRVLYTALDIAREEDADRDVLIAACLLHDIGRARQSKDPSLCHALEGGRMAYAYLLGQGWPEDRAAHVRSCIASHRYRADQPPESIEAKVLFDADKLDAAGALGIARTILYNGQHDEPLYTLDPHGRVSESPSPDAPSFVQEYQFKLKRVYDTFFTRRGREIAQQRQRTAEAYYHDLLAEVAAAYEGGAACLESALTEK